MNEILNAIAEIPKHPIMTICSTIATVIAYKIAKGA